MKRIVIVGGGITGLAAAYRLQQRIATSGTPAEIQLLEASSHLGGTLHTTSRDGFLLEGGPDCFLGDKLGTLELINELGLTDQLVSTRAENRRSFIVRAGKLHPIPEGFYLIAPSRLRPFLASPLLSWRGKWRMLLEPLLPSEPRTDESLAYFVQRRLGKEALDWLAQPLLAGIYAADPETLSLRATFPQFLEMEKKYGSVLVGLKMNGAATQQASGARYSLFMSLRDGMQSLADQLEKKLSSVLIQRGTAVTHLRKENPGWELRLANGDTLKADAVCLALPSFRCAELLRAENRELADLLDGIPYAGSATLHFAFKEGNIRHPLDGFGFVTPRAENRPTLACTFVHRKFAGRVPAGHVLLRAFVGGALQRDLLFLSDTELEQRVLEDLTDLLGITGRPLFTVIDRWPQAMPQYTVGHVLQILNIEEKLLGMPGLTLAGNWLRGVGIPDCIESGQRTAATLIEHLQKKNAAAISSS